ncbi:MAG: 4-(cytidine 5'-diphospho)-2-C-methyl-D-erythritol kinase [Deltaproteobacteria bacterium]|nr:4-(cytidine 5'-diphospho)-2-C-methyl-D-erythritol kinase [Deltaproteobacteria bacterium]
MIVNRKKLVAWAKINLHLKITGRRDDGYHLLDMVMVKLDLSDEIETELVHEGIEIRSNVSTIPVNSSNTLWKMATLVAEESGKKFGLRIFLKKNSPVAAGLGAGSSDAAALLLWLNQVLELGWSEQRLGEIGACVGADVPFFLLRGACRVQGIGEVLSPFIIESYPVILINPGFPVSTKEAYRWFDENIEKQILKAGGSDRAPTRATPPEGLTAIRVGGTTFPLENDLEKVVIPRYPVLDRIKKLLIDAGALVALMSGSGPTVFGLFESTASRDRGYEVLKKQRDPNWWMWNGRSL